MKRKAYGLLSALVGFLFGFATAAVYFINKMYNLINDVLINSGVKIPQQLLDELIKYGMERAGIP